MKVNTAPSPQERKGRFPKAGEKLPLGLSPKHTYTARLANEGR